MFVSQLHNIQCHGANLHNNEVLPILTDQSYLWQVSPVRVQCRNEERELFVPSSRLRSWRIEMSR